MAEQLRTSRRDREATAAGRGEHRALPPTARRAAQARPPLATPGCCLKPSRTSRDVPSATLPPSSGAAVGQDDEEEKEEEQPPHTPHGGTRGLATPQGGGGRGGGGRAARTAPHRAGQGRAGQGRPSHLPSEAALSETVTGGARARGPAPCARPCLLVFVFFPQPHPATLPPAPPRIGWFPPAVAANRQAGIAVGGDGRVVSPQEGEREKPSRACWRGGGRRKEPFVRGGEGRGGEGRGGGHRGLCGVAFTGGCGRSVREGAWGKRRGLAPSCSGPAAPWCLLVEIKLLYAL